MEKTKYNSVYVSKLIQTPIILSSSVDMLSHESIKLLNVVDGSVTQLIS